MKGNKVTLGIKNEYLRAENLFDLQDTFIKLGELAGVSLDDVAPLKYHLTIGEATAYVNRLAASAKESGQKYSIFTLENGELTQDFTNDVEDAEVCDINETV